MAKSFSDFSGSIPDDEDEFHVAVDGNLRLINFEVNISTLRPQHRTIIEKKLVPFLLAATKFLGPGDYELRCAGTASATGTFSRNGVLSDERAHNAAIFAIESFNNQAPTNPHVSACQLTPREIPLADTAAQQDKIDRHISQQDVERKQAVFRSAQFFLSARKRHPKGSEIFQIREIYLFNFKSKAEPLPVALQRIKQVVASQSIIKFFAKRITVLKKLIDRLDAFSKLVGDALGPEGKLALIIIEFMIPDEMDACYEIKNSENNHALYRLNGSGNKTSFGIMDLLGIIAEAVAAMKGVVKALKTVLGLPKGAEKTIQFIEKFIKDLHTDAVEFARTFGPGFAELVDIILTMTENGVTSQAMFAPASGFVPFLFHDRTAEHQVAQLAGPARRNVFGIGFNEVVDVEFGGFVPNNFSDFQAEAKIKRIVVDLLEIQTIPAGQFFLLKGNYSSDVIVGPTDIVKD
jgi:hypothetical protein